MNDTTNCIVATIVGRRAVHYVTVKPHGALFSACGVELTKGRKCLVTSAEPGAVTCKRCQRSPQWQYPLLRVPPPDSQQRTVSPTGLSEP